MNPSQDQNESFSEQSVPRYPEQAERLALFADFKRFDIPGMAREIDEEYKTYVNYHKGMRRMPPEFRVKLYKMGMNLNWLETGEGGMLRIGAAPESIEFPPLPWETVRKAVVLVEEETKSRAPMSPKTKASLVLVTGRELVRAPEEEQGEIVARERLQALLASAAAKAEEALRDIETANPQQSNPK